MPELMPGDAAPDFTLPATGGDITLSKLKGRKVVLYFYPKDDTPGCTAESCAFRDNLKEFDKLGAQVIGISRDSLKSHEKFRDKYKLTFPLASDEDGRVCETYGVWTEKSMYGKKYMGIERSTFLINEQGKIAQIWRRVKVKGHAEEVKEAIQKIAKAA